MKVGLFFGTFNPIHIGHLILGNHIQQYTDLDQVWYVVTPRSPFKKNEKITDDYTRLHMVELAIEDYPHLAANDIEFRLKKPNYTTDTLAVLREKYPKYEFALIMGQDNVSHLHKWKNADFLVRAYDIFVYPRIHEDNRKPKIDLSRVHHVQDAPIIEISSSFIRKAFAEKKNVQPLLPPKVFEYIDGSNIY